MIYMRADDFYEKVASVSALSRQEEIEYARQMKNGDMLARERLIQGYLPVMAAFIRRKPSYAQNLGLILHCQQALEKAVDTFDFLQDREPFSHRLNWHLRQAAVRYLIR